MILQVATRTAKDARCAGFAFKNLFPCFSCGFDAGTALSAQFLCWHLLGLGEIADMSGDCLCLIVIVTGFLGCPGGVSQFSLKVAFPGMCEKTSMNFSGMKNVQGMSGVASSNGSCAELQAPNGKKGCST